MSNNLSDIIESKLSIINNLPVRYIGRACNMVWIGFGEDITTKNHKNVAKYALHLQCDFRIIDSEKIILGSSDIYEPNSITEWTENFNWDISGANLYDEIAKTISGIYKTEQIIVTKISADNYGDIKIEISNGYIIEIFLSSSSKEECWRFFESGNNDSHFVITGKGVGV